MLPSRKANSRNASNSDDKANKIITKKSRMAQEAGMNLLTYVDPGTELSLFSEYCRSISEQPALTMLGRANKKFRGRATKVQNVEKRQEIDSVI